jgi:NAD-dependent dihydropyrimidine dehydrogenase PreA subunit
MAVTVPCLGRVEESLVAGLADGGADAVTLVRGLCEKCVHATGYASAQAVCENANLLLDVWGSPVRACLSERFPAPVATGTDDELEAARREAFSDGTSAKAAGRDDLSEDAGAAGASEAADPGEGEGSGSSLEGEEPRFIRVMADGTLPHFLPDRREHLLEALSDLGEPRDETVATRLWGHVSIDPEKCVSCRMCTVFCPTGALMRFDDDDGTFGVEHYPQDCVKCRCCEDICYAGAITVADEVSSTDLVEGHCERFVMKPVEDAHGGVHSIINAMQGLTEGTQVYER